ncbi:Panacea domain-containing protein [Brucella intermedia]|uniref:Panacea domain-containing protein n=1 Tax=Brucella intermedia TaxID=94625 RepID=UPI00178C2C53|nr:type II toxin-antitoxin system antitoxin SocA domain-containing protein [Brucella intermedia]
MEKHLETSHDARAIANYILDRAPEKGVEKLTLMQLLKLVYLSHGWSLAFHDTPLVAQNPQAWQYGPVYPHIYKALNKFGGSPVAERIIDKLTGIPVYPVEMSDRQKRVIDAVLLSYGQKHAFELSNITHMSDGPWDKTIQTQGVYKEIPLVEMRDHYKKLAAERGIKSI